MGHFDDRRSAGSPGRGGWAGRLSVTSPAASWPVPDIRVQPGTNYIYR
jgi:hypothetical protein